jgi:hypothetical protein
VRWTKTCAPTGSSGSRSTKRTGSLRRLRYEEGRRFFQDLPLHLELGVLPTQPVSSARSADGNGNTPLTSGTPRSARSAFTHLHSVVSLIFKSRATSGRQVVETFRFIGGLRLPLWRRVDYPLIELRATTDELTFRVRFGLGLFACLFMFSRSPWIFSQGEVASIRATEDIFFLDPEARG